MTLGTWNPNTPNRVGLEVLPGLPAGGFGSFPVTATRGWRQTYRGLDTMTTCDTFLTNVSQLAPGKLAGLTAWRVFVAEVFEAGDEVLAESDWSAWTAFAPNQIVADVGPWVNHDASEPPVVTNIDESIPSIADALVMVEQGATASIDLRFATGSASLTGKRIRCRVRMQCCVSIGESAKITMEISNGGTYSIVFAEQTVAARYPDFRTLTFDLPETIDPGTFAPWNEAEVQAMDSTSHVRINVKPDIYSQFWLSWVTFEISTVDENRVAFGAVANGTGGGGGTDFWRYALTREEAAVWLDPPATVGAFSGWSRASSTDYVVVVRPPVMASTFGGMKLRAASGLSLALVPGYPTVHYLHGPIDPAYAGYDVSACALAATGFVTEADTGLELPAGAHAQVVLTDAFTGPQAATDSIPYVRVVEPEVHTTSDVAQEISAPASSSYHGIEFLVRFDPFNPPTEDLTVEVLRDSDSAVFGTGTVTLDMIRAAPSSPGGWKLVSVTLGSVVALVSGTDYSLTFTSTTPADRPYYLVAFDSYRGPDGATGAASSYYTHALVGTFGGAEGLSVNGTEWPLTSYFTADLVAWLYHGPPAPAGFAAVATAAPVNEWQSGAVTDEAVVKTPPTETPYVALSWVPLYLGALHSAYRIQRRDTLDTDWQTVAVLTDDAASTFDDYRARVGVESTYRIRTESIHGGGPWGPV